MASSSKIQKIIRDVQTAIERNKFIPVSRRKNMETLARLGITWNDAKEEIYELEERHYHKGPSRDRDIPESDRLWVFKKMVLGENIYIKFKVMYQEDGQVKVISFHIDEQ